MIISQTIQTVNKSGYNQRYLAAQSIFSLVEEDLGRVINPEGAGKERTQLMRSVVLALRELMQQNTIDQNTRDLAAYLALALNAIDQTVEITVTAWEKRDYWLKADRFRMEWAWAGRLGGKMRAAVLVDDWPQVAQIAATVAEKVKQTEVPKKHGINSPWEGAWDRLVSSSNKNSRQ